MQDQMIGAVRSALNHTRMLDSDLASDAEAAMIAKAVLRAIREPSEGMKDAGGFVTSAMENRKRWEVAKMGDRRFSEQFATETWQAMIDAALGE